MGEVAIPPKIQLRSVVKTSNAILTPDKPTTSPKEPPRHTTMHNHNTPPPDDSTTFTRTQPHPAVKTSKNMLSPDNLITLPKAHLHLHFTGSLDLATLAELAQSAHDKAAAELINDGALTVPATVKGWFRFQRTYDLARRVVCTEAAMRRVVQQAARNDAAEGVRRLEIQIDPTSYAPHVGGIIPALEIVLDEAKAAAHATGIQVAVIVAASRMRHPMEARTLARLASKYAGQGSGEVCGFGLSNDEWAGASAEWEGAFRIARAAGLPGVPHGGELRGADHVRQVVTALHPRRIGHGIRAAEDPRLVDELVASQVAFEVCPTSNVQLGIYPRLNAVPLQALLSAGAQIALGADDPLLFHARLNAQYQAAQQDMGCNLAQLAELAASSIRVSFAPDSDKARWLSEVAFWRTAQLASSQSSPPVIARSVSDEAIQKSNY
ncbi:MAG: adenosine deaminase [Propionibacteriaceae bacterium]|jgi:adenosine deaminase|nr:adenosine deaminase [Propionibacteriaceae bacterium]